MVELHTLGILWLFHWQCHVRCDSLQERLYSQCGEKSGTIGFEGDRVQQSSCPVFELLNIDPYVETDSANFD